MLTAFLADAKSITKSRMNRDETGATAVEYSIMVALIAVAIIVAVTLLGGSLTAQFKGIACSIKGGTMSASTTVDATGVVTPGTCSV